MKKLCPESERYDLARWLHDLSRLQSTVFHSNTRPLGLSMTLQRKQWGQGKRPGGLERKTLMTEMETGVCEGVGIT